MVVVSVVVMAAVVGTVEVIMVVAVVVMETMTVIMVVVEMAVGLSPVQRWPVWVGRTRCHEQCPLAKDIRNTWVFI